MNNTIAAVVVTYNRKELLIECLESIRKQTLAPNAIFIVDNHSTDGTPDLLTGKNYITKPPKKISHTNQYIQNSVPSINNPTKSIQIKYIRKFENDGGAGGFYEGMKQAYNCGFDWLWMMDDDGVPDNLQLEHMLKYSLKHNLQFSNALVVDNLDNSKLAFGVSNYRKVSEIKENEILLDSINPFNGTFISKVVPEKVGLIKKEMFIWGDETEYFLRAKKFGFKIATVIKAVHNHPASQTKWTYIIPFLKFKKIELKPSHRNRIFFRNKGYIHSRYSNTNGILYIVFLYTLFFLSRLRFKQLLLFYIYFIEGASDKFNKK